MKIFSKENIKILAQQNGWTIAQAEGYVEGKRLRTRGVVPSKFLLVGIDDYCLGFRAGYFARDRKPPSAKAVAE